MYVVMIMACYWITEAVPLPVASMLPIVLFPMLGILVSILLGVFGNNLKMTGLKRVKLVLFLNKKEIWVIYRRCYNMPKIKEPNEFDRKLS